MTDDQGLEPATARDTGHFVKLPRQPLKPSSCRGELPLQLDGMRPRCDRIYAVIKNIVPLQRPRMISCHRKIDGQCTISSALFSIIHESRIQILKEIYCTLLSVPSMNSGWRPGHDGPVGHLACLHHSLRPLILHPVQHQKLWHPVRFLGPDSSFAAYPSATLGRSLSLQKTQLPQGR